MYVPMHAHKLTVPRSLASFMSVSSDVAEHFEFCLASDYVSPSRGQTFRHDFIILEVKVVSGWLPEPRTEQCRLQLKCDCTLCHTGRGSEGETGQWNG